MAVLPTPCGSACTPCASASGGRQPPASRGRLRAPWEEIGRFCSEQRIDAWYQQGGYLQVSAAPAQDGVWDEAVATCRELGEAGAVEQLSAEQVRQRCRSPRFRAGVLYGGAATVQPARLALGLRERLSDRPGLRVFERSPLRRLRAGSWGCLGETPRARIRSASCVLALGPASGAAGSPMRGRLTVTSSLSCWTEPVPELLQEIGWTGGECITDGRAMVHLHANDAPMGGSPSAGAAAGSPAAHGWEGAPSLTPASSTAWRLTCARSSLGWRVVG